MIQIQSLTFNPFAENTYLLYDETRACVIIDPGCYEAHEEESLDVFIADKGLTPVRVINTHCHIDHLIGVKYITEKYKLGFEFHQSDNPVFESTDLVARMYGIPNLKLPPKPLQYLDDTAAIEFGNSKLDVLFVPGHSPGHLAFYNRTQKFIVAGDVLFSGSIGRTDLPGGDFDTLISSIKDKIFPLGDEFTVFCGHGPETTIGEERKNNPFLK